jgi:hypothetical protein
MTTQSPATPDPAMVAALAERLHETGECENWSPGYRYLDENDHVQIDLEPDMEAHRRSAAAILADGSTFHAGPCVMPAAFLIVAAVNFLRDALKKDRP